jgi:hypothetical protein
MGDPNYEAHRKERRERQEQEARELEERRQREKLATEVADLSLGALRDFLCGHSVLVVERIDGGRMTVRFQR